MKKTTLIILFISAFVMITVQPSWATIKKHNNPVHARRQAIADKNREVYKGEKIIEVEDKDKKEGAEGQKKDSNAKKNAAEKADDAFSGRLAELMKSFDKDGDGVISYEEMEAARAAGKDIELRKLLADKKAATEKLKKSKAASDTESSAR
ncbi:MAG: EF-hand domain-containing protein [Candidatus Omnitrophica bacterium]|nr:EF-hand domain-containing protein [Candidatus Omnitrophota bacterium]